MTDSTRDRRRSHLASAAVALILLTGCAGNAVTPLEVASPPASRTSPSVLPTAPMASAERTSSSSPNATPTAQSAVMKESEPAFVHIPAVGTQSELLHLGLQDNGSLQVPPGDPGAPAAWYDGSPTPRERGPAILLGHVNATDGGPGVFARLRELKPGDVVQVAREDGTTAVFTVNFGEQYNKENFPTQDVYGNTEGAELRLITCDGYDPDTGLFSDNYVVYATLVH